MKATRIQRRPWKALGFVSPLKRALPGASSNGLTEVVPQQHDSARWVGPLVAGVDHRQNGLQRFAGRHLPPKEVTEQGTPLYYCHFGIPPAPRGTRDEGLLTTWAHLAGVRLTVA